MCGVALNNPDILAYKASWITPHLAVVCFVLISGWFHIKPTLVGGCKLIWPLLLFYLPFTLYDIMHGNQSIVNLMFFSRSPYWFIRMYFCLFLLSPLLNWFLDNRTKTEKTMLVLALGFISVYLGCVHEDSLETGKNVPMFMFLYALGDYLRSNSDRLSRITTSKLWVLWIISNVIYVLLYMLSGSIGRFVVWQLCFRYCGPLMILNGVLFFLAFSRLKIRSKAINYISASVLSVYVIHHNELILRELNGVTGWISTESPTPIMTLIGVLGLSIIVFFACVALDKLLQPVTKVVLSKVKELQTSSEIVN